MPDLAIETESLRKHFDRTVAVADLSLAIRRGEVFGFLGPNGAGKTTSLKLLLGLIDPTGGAGTVLGAPLGTRGTRSKIGFLPEHFRFHDCLTGRELLRIHGRLFGLRGTALEARIDALLARVALTEAADRRLHTYSKGMIQRAGLAQALVNSPELVFLDEPTSGLDPLGRVLVRSIIEELRAAGTTVFLNSHLLGEVEATCDRVAFVKKGRVIDELSLGEASQGLDVELKLGGAERAVLEGLGAFGELGDLDPVEPDGGDRNGGAVAGAQCVVRLRLANESALPELAPWLVARGIALYELRVRRKSLEESFIEIMGDDQTRGDMGRILTIAHLTFIEAYRRKIVPAVLLCSALFLLVYGTALYFINLNIPQSPQRQFQLQFFVLAGLYVANFLAIAAAVLLPVDTLSGEIDSGVMQTLASKPIRRAEIVIGKWLTYWLMTGSYLVIIAGGVVVVARLTTGFAQQHLALALPLMLLGATFMLTVSIAGSARLKTVTNGIVAFGFYGIAFIGGWIEQIGAFTRNDASRYVGTALSLASPSDALWRRAAYELQPPVMRGLQLTPFGAGRVPSDAMIWWAAAITALALLFAIRVIKRRAL